MVAKTIPFEEWIPDAYTTKEGLMTDVINLIPSMDGYKGVKSFKELSSAVPDFDVNCYPRSAETFILSDGEIVTVVGTDNNLYLRASGQDWENVSKSLGCYSAGNRWKFVLFGNLIIATNFTDPIQCLDLSDSDGKFGDLSVTAPHARDLAIVNEFLVLVGTSDSYDGDRPQRVWWSPIGDPQGTWVPDQTTMCDYQDVFSGSYITGIVGGEDALILLRDALVRMTFVGSPVVFQFQTITTDFGNIGYDTYTHVDGMTFFLSSAGFKCYGNGSVEPIGLGKVDNFLFSDTDGLVSASSIAAADTRNSCVWWAYRDKTARDGDIRETTRALVYHYPTKRWGKVHSKVLAFCDVCTAGYTLDGLDAVTPNIDDLPYSLDSEAWKGGIPSLAAFSVDGKFGYFLGELYDAELTTGSFPMSDAHDRVFVRRIRPHIDGTEVKVQIALAGLQEETEEPVYTSFMNKTRVGDFAFRVSGRFHKLKMKVSGAFKKVIGFLVDYDSAGEF